LRIITMTVTQPGAISFGAQTATAMG